MALIPLPRRIVQIRIVEAAVRSPALTQQPSNRTRESGMSSKPVILESLHSTVVSLTGMPRKPFPPLVQAAVLIHCRRRCAFCFCLENDAGEKAGQLAHIDRNPENNARENAAFLCLEHHSRY